MALVVSDTSPVRALDHLGLVDLLGVLFAEVVVPPAVESELGQPRPRFRPVRITDYPFVRVQAPANLTDVTALSASFGPGESEAIVLAAELGAELLMDEAAGRAEAQRRGLRRVGVVGVLIRAKQRGLVPAVLPLAERLRDELGFYLSPPFVLDIRRLTGE